MQESTRDFVKRTVYLILFTVIVVTVILVIASLNTQIQGPSDQNQNSAPLSKTVPTQPINTIRETQDEQLTKEAIGAPSVVFQDTVNAYSFLVGAVSGSLITIVLFAIVSVIKKREEMKEKALQEERDFRRRRAREQINTKMDSLLGRFNQTAGEARRERINSEKLLLRGPKDL